MAVNFDTSPKVKVKVGKDFPYYIPEALGLKRSLRNRVLVGVVHLDKNWHRNIMDDNCRRLGNRKNVGKVASLNKNLV